MFRQLFGFAFVWESPFLRRIAWHGKRIAGQLDRRFFLALLEGAAVFVLIGAILVTLLEKPWTESIGQAIGGLGQSINWAVFTVLGKGDSSFVKTPGGYVVSWILALFGVAIVGTITGALVAVVIDFLLKEGQGLGASGYRDHIVVCGWNATARDPIDELRGVAESLGTLAPLKLNKRAFEPAREPIPVPVREQAGA